MKKLLEQVTKVIKALDEKKFTFLSEDNCEDNLDYLEVEGHEVIVGDGTNRQTWNVALNNIAGKSDLPKLLIETLGEPIQIIGGKRMVHNWEPTKNVLVVYSGDSIEFTQYYTKK